MLRFEIEYINIFRFVKGFEEVASARDNTSNIDTPK